MKDYLVEIEKLTKYPLPDRGRIEVYSVKNKEKSSTIEGLM